MASLKEICLLWINGCGSIRAALCLALERLKDNTWDFQYGIFPLGNPSKIQNALSMGLTT